MPLELLQFIFIWLDNPFEWTRTCRLFYSVSQDPILVLRWIARKYPRWQTRNKLPTVRVLFRPTVLGKIVNSIPTQQRSQFYVSVFLSACSLHHYPAIQWAIQNSVRIQPNITRQALRLAILDSRADILEWLIEHKVPLVHPSDIHLAGIPLILIIIIKLNSHLPQQN
jgi:hypothetical protein